MPRHGPLASSDISRYSDISSVTWCNRDLMKKCSSVADGDKVGPLGGRTHTHNLALILSKATDTVMALVKIVVGW